MPKIPVYTDQATPKASTDPLLESVSNAGGVFRSSQKLGQAALDRGNELQKESEIMEASDALSSLYDQERTFFTDELQKQGKESYGGQDRGNEFYHKTATDMGNKMSDGARVLFNEKVKQVRTHGLNRLASHQAQQHQKQKEMTFESAAAAVRTKIKEGINDQEVDMHIADLKTQVSSLYKGLDTGKIEAAIEESVLNDFMIEKAATDPDDIERLLTKYKDKIPEDKQKAIKDLSERMHLEQQVSDGFAELNAAHGDNFGAMLKESKSMGLSPKVQSRLQTKIKNEWATDKAIKAEAKQKANVAQGNEIVQMWAAKEYSAITDKVLKSEVLTPQQKEHWIDKVERQTNAELKDETKPTPSDPFVYSNISAAINLSPHSVTKERIWSREGIDLSTKDAQALSNKLDVLQKKPDQRMKTAAKVIDEWRKLWVDDNIGEAKAQADAGELNRMLNEWHEQNPELDPVQDFLVPRQAELAKGRLDDAFAQWERQQTGQGTRASVSSAGGQKVTGKILPPNITAKPQSRSKWYKQWLGQDLTVEE